MTENLIELCCIIIEDIYGGFLAHIFKQLARYGRLSAMQVAQRCHLPGRQAKAGLATLAQLRLVQHHSTSDGFNTYQAEIYNAYNLVRVGKLQALAHKRWGKTAVTILGELMALGFASVRSLTEETLAVLAPSSSGEGRQASVLMEVNDSLESLVADGFVHQVRHAHLLIPHDARNMIDQDLKANPPTTESKAKGRKLQEEFAGFVQQELQQRTDSKLRLDDLRPQLMHSRLTDEGLVLDNMKPEVDEIYLAVNFGRAKTAIRDEVTSQCVRKMLGDGSSNLVSALMPQIGTLSTLRHGSQSSMSLRLPEHETIDLGKLRHSLTHTENKRPNGVDQTNGYHDDTEMVNGVDESLTQNGTDEEDLDDALSLIAEGPFPFLIRDDGIDTWKVDKVKLSVWLRDREILKMISERTGQVGLRLIRMLIAKGKLDEKVMQELGLLNAKELRQTLADLQQRGFIEIQEVPRDPQRTVARTIFLWFFDSERVQRALLGDLYKSIARAYQRLRLERQRVQTTLAKVERSDVRGNEDEVLSSAELLVLQQFRRKEKWLMGEIARLDDSVALLRDS